MQEANDYEAQCALLVEALAAGGKEIGAACWLWLRRRR